MAVRLPRRSSSPNSDAQYRPSVMPVTSFGPIPPRVRLLALVTVLCFALALLPGFLHTLFGLVRWLALALLAGLTLFYAVRRMQHGLLWRLRNKLVLTYLLIGLAPVLLFFTLVFLAAYVAAGQFAIHLATSHLQAQLEALGQSNLAMARHAERRSGTAPPDQPLMLPEVRERTQTEGADGLQMAFFREAQPLPMPGLAGHARTPLGWENWLAHRGEASYRAIVEDGGLLYLAATDRVIMSDGQSLTVISSLPLNRDRLVAVAAGLGRVELLPGLNPRPRHESSTAELQQARISGGNAPPAVNLLDVRVRFFSTLPVREWESGVALGVPLDVESRPSLLYDQLFAAALSGAITDTVRVVFLGICVVFALIEAFALWMGLRLARTVTESVEDLYAATISVDRGELQHRIAVQRDDQLADLCRSFNRMSWSLGRLMEEQKEKERIESELTIAQEVQANLFPAAQVTLSTLDLHGICRPARTVSGDYYDFLTFEKERPGREGSSHTEISGLGIALGDISGKGISAALLMATLHSAVRAYRFASEELLAPDALAATHGESQECSELFASPARMLGLLNRHLYRSTTAEKYATLFLAHYDCEAAKLTYANAGQLPPVLLRVDGSIDRLDRGGTVVGLMDGMTYEEESLHLNSGDILIAYSDGVTEPENDFGDFGEDRLIELVRRFRREPLEVISAEVMSALNAWIGEGEQPDDITLVLARQA